MFVSSQTFANGEQQTERQQSKRNYLRPTQQLDIHAPKLRTKTLSLTQLQHTDRRKAVALHQFVQSLPFGCVPDYSALTADAVLKLGYGDCFTKGMLLVAMLRSASIAARLRFVSLPVHFLRGIVDSDEATIMHAMAEVYLDGRWVVTDSYVPDAALFEAAKKKLQSENRPLGYGIHIAGARAWNGLHDASAQCVASDPSSLPTVDWGVADDPISFYADPSHSELRRNFAMRLKWRLGAGVVNKRVQAIRDDH
ncbi:MAG: transglutaminase domain-containing protein [Brachymonas sp.]|nr:transglutaminase domain-containing protein [Brachymonas sp.]